MSPPRPARIARIRTVAQDAMRGGRWWTMLDLEDTLRTDAEFWRDLWAPSLAIAAHKVGLPRAKALIQEAVEAGFHQLDLFEPELSAAFGRDDDWPALLDRMAANLPDVPLRITAWPEPGRAAPLHLDRIDAHRESGLLRRLPKPREGAWDTAITVLAWTSGLWRHANSRINVGDSLDVLEQVAVGARYSCVEYSMVLAQSLNALRVPARRVDLRRGGYHDGVGQGHAVAEAWIDDLDRWVLLDGQHGVYWAGEDGVPLSLPELQERASPAKPVAVGQRAMRDPGMWFAYFRHAAVTGAAWADEYVPLFQQRFVLATEQLLHDSADAYPRLSDVGIGIVAAGAGAGVRVRPVHPYASGAAMLRPDTGEDRRADATWPLDTAPGEHVAEVAAVTPYGRLAGRELRWRT
jgi:hypothetical protein